MTIWKSAVATALAVNMGMAVAGYTPSDFRAKGIPMPSLVLYDGSTASITVIGDISPTVLTSFRALVVDNPQVTRVYIDSQGGALPSALDMARIIHDRNLSLVVDGRCFSACANFIFVAARRKTVLPGSVVGIHEKSTAYADPREKGVVKSASGHEAEQELRAIYGSDRMKEWDESLRKEQAFYREFGIRQDLYVAYADYVSNRKKSLGLSDVNTVPGNPLCPRLRSWLLTRDQLVSIGVKGIEGFWFPHTDKEKQSLYKTFGLPADSLYTGSAGQLQAYCKGFGGSAVVRHWYALHDFFKS